MKPAPCKGCTERHEACHGHCERYLAWVQPLRDNYHDRAMAKTLGGISEGRKRKMLTSWQQRQLRNKG